MSDLSLLYEIFDRSVTAYPDRIAIDVAPSFPDRPYRSQVTYEELADRATRIAAWLAPVAERDVIVAILLPRHTPDLYAAQLGVLRAGAAFTCLDTTFPNDHVQYVLEDSAAAALVTDTAGRLRAERLGLTCPVYDVDRSISCLTHTPPAWPSDPKRLAYVIYTSGTTGRPKGVMIDQPGIVNLVAANRDYFGLTTADRVAQCSSTAYDSSIEETWLAFAAGATLVPLDHDTVRLGPDLVPWLARERVTVLCPPPTLLRATGCSHPEAALPDLRLLYVGGEPLPPDLAKRWSRGRRMVNGYGPTECTVTVLRGPVQPSSPISIGKPVDGHSAWVLDDALNEVPAGTVGELCIGGIGLARGYLNLRSLTDERFVLHPQFGRIYRTGDTARVLADGTFEHLGRRDGQVKLRGHRIELEAIESALAECPGVRAAGCRLQGEEANRLIAAHVVPDRPDHLPDLGQLRDELNRRFPSSMIPARFGFIDRLPIRVGGKIDRDALPILNGASHNSGCTVAPPADTIERDIRIAFTRALELPSEVSGIEDFFLDLGGHSVAAVNALLLLREAGYGSVTVRDLYETRTAVGLADRLRGREAEPVPARVEPSAAGVTPPTRVNPTMCSVIQAAWLLAGLFVIAGVSCFTVFEIMPLVIGAFGLFGASVVGPLLLAVALPVYVVVAVTVTVAVKRVLIGRYRAGRHPAWGGVYIRHWIVTSVAGAIPWRLMGGTVFQSAVLRALGARIGSRVYFHPSVDVSGGGWDLLTVGDDVTLGQDARILPVEFDRGEVVFGPVVLGDGATLDVRSGVSPGSSVGRNGYLTPLSWLPPGQHVTDAERWDGIPAHSVGIAPPRPATAGEVKLFPVVHGILVVLGRCMPTVIVWVGVLALIASSVSAPDIWLTNWLRDPQLSLVSATLIAFGAMLVVPVSLVAQGMAIRACGKVRPGVYHQWSLTAIRIGIKVGVTEATGGWLSGTLYWPWWLRLAGARVGHRCEISSVIGLLPETLTVADDCFLADGIYVGGPVLHGGTFVVSETTLGHGTFLGNHAVIPPGHQWPAGLFIGVATVPDPHRMRPDSAWFGHPPIELPRREVATDDRRRTHAPSTTRVLVRLLWETLRFVLPTVPLAVGYGWMWCVTRDLGNTAYWLTVVAAATLAAPAALCLAAVGLKWALLGRVQPGRHPLWSSWCSRWDLMYFAWEHLAQRPASALEGTLFLNALLRLTGMRIGRGVLLGGGASQVVDPDMIAIEDGATVAADFQAHTFEDRVLKIGNVWVGSNASLGPHSVVLYESEVGPAARVMPHAVVMKRARLESGRTYVGHPAH